MGRPKGYQGGGGGDSAPAHPRRRGSTRGGRPHGAQRGRAARAPPPRHGYQIGRAPSAADEPSGTATDGSMMETVAAQWCLNRVLAQGGGWADFTSQQLAGDAVAGRNAQEYVGRARKILCSGHVRGCWIWPHHEILLYLAQRTLLIANIRQSSSVTIHTAGQLEASTM